MASFCAVHRGLIDDFVKENAGVRWGIAEGEQFGKI
jgi:hypothetical protein